MLSENMKKELNNQINEELFSSYLYLSMSAYLNAKGLSGFSNWMRIQAKEELDHATKFFDYILERNEIVTLETIDQPKHEWNGILDIFEATLAHERHITERINFLASLAIEEKDFATQSFLKWFIDEQVEEEANDENMLNKLRLIGDNSSAIFFLDQEAGSRVYVAPTAQ